MARRHILRHLAPLLGLAGIGVLGWWAFVARPAQFRAIAETQAREAIDRGRRALLEGDPRAALRAVARLSDQGPQAADVLTVRALGLAALDRPDEARPLLERSLKLQPAQPMAAKVLAAVYFSDGDVTRGFAQLERAAELDPADFRPWYATGEVLLRILRRPREAVDVYRGALKRKPDDAGARAGLAQALLELGDVNESAGLVDGLLADSPDDPKILLLAVRRASLLARADEVERLVARILESEPDQVDAYLLRGRTRLRSGRRDAALPDAERAVSLAPENLEALDLLGRVEGALGLEDRAQATTARFNQARETTDRLEKLRDAIRKQPDDLEARLRLGQEAARAGKADLARRCFRAALVLDPNCEPARAGLAALGPPGPIP